MRKSCLPWERSIVFPGGGKQFRTGKKSENAKSGLLETYTSDLTERARQGELDPLIGRSDELQRMIQILSRRGKNNPCLIGEPVWENRDRGRTGSTGSSRSRTGASAGKADPDFGCSPEW